MGKQKKLDVTEVKDFTGMPVHIGDTVVYIYRTYTKSAELKKGVVKGFCRLFGCECAIIDDYGFDCKVTSPSFYRIG